MKVVRSSFVLGIFVCMITGPFAFSQSNSTTSNTIAAASLKQFATGFKDVCWPSVSKMAKLKTRFSESGFQEIPATKLPASLAFLSKQKKSVLVKSQQRAYFMKTGNVAKETLFARAVIEEWSATGMYSCIIVGKGRVDQAQLVNLDSIFPMPGKKIPAGREWRKLSVDAANIVARGLKRPNGSTKEEEDWFFFNSASLLFSKAAK